MRGLKNVSCESAFGAVNQKRFKVGELIEWKTLISSRERQSPSIGEKFYGVVIEFYVETKTGREVRMARILPIASQQIVEVPCIILKKVETN